MLRISCEPVTDIFLNYNPLYWLIISAVMTATTDIMVAMILKVIL